MVYRRKKIRPKLRHRADRPFTTTAFGFKPAQQEGETESMIWDFLFKRHNPPTHQSQAESGGHMRVDCRV